MTPATEQVLRKLLQSMKVLCESALALMGQDEEPQPEQKPRFLGDTDGEGQEHQ